MNNRKSINIPVVAMADIAFLLLIFLMVSSIISSKKGVHINLPKTSESVKVSTKRSEDIFITEEGKYYFNGKQITLNELKNILETKTALSKKMMTFIYGDEEVEYEYIDRLINMLESIKLRNCVFVTIKNNEYINN